MLYVLSLYLAGDVVVAAAYLFYRGSHHGAPLNGRDRDIQCGRDERRRDGEGADCHTPGV
jgi:hypothetical protein